MKISQSNITMMTLGKSLDYLQKSRPNIYTIIIMVSFIAFFEAVSRLLAHILPPRDSYASIIVSFILIILIIVVFISQDGTL